MHAMPGGTEKAARLMAQKDWNKELLSELATAMRDASICGLGQAAPNPLSERYQVFSGRGRPDHR